MSTLDRIENLRLGKRSGDPIMVGRLDSRENSAVRQLQLFTTAELAVMRDRTKRRNYSAEADEFRRTHERHRAWGLTQRHSRKLRRLYGHVLDDKAIEAAWSERVAAASATCETEPVTLASVENAAVSTADPDVPPVGEPGVPELSEGILVGASPQSVPEPLDDIVTAPDSLPDGEPASSLPVAVVAARPDSRIPRREVTARPPSPGRRSKRPPRPLRDPPDRSRLRPAL